MHPKVCVISPTRRGDLSQPSKLAFVTSLATAQPSPPRILEKTAAIESQTYIAILKQPLPSKSLNLLPLFLIR